MLLPVVSCWKYMEDNQTQMKKDIWILLVVPLSQLVKILKINIIVGDYQHPAKTRGRKDSIQKAREGISIKRVFHIQLSRVLRWWLQWHWMFSFEEHELGSMVELHLGVSCGAQKQKFQRTQEVFHLLPLVAVHGLCKLVLYHLFPFLKFCVRCVVQ